MEERTYSLLTEDERNELPRVIGRRLAFQRLLRANVRNFDNTVWNCLLLTGRAGTGKTYSTTECLELFKEEGILSDYRITAGHCVPSALYSMLKSTATPDDLRRPNVLVLDDVDCLKDEGCLALMKAAFDSKSKTPSNRHVYYKSRVGKEVIEDRFKYEGFGIIIANDDFYKKKTTNPHLVALLDRVQHVTIDMEKDDMFIYNVSLVENYLNDEAAKLGPKTVKNIVSLMENEVREWHKHDAFRRAGVNFSIRLIQKFVDLERLMGDDWKLFDTTYHLLESACEVNESITHFEEEMKVVKAKQSAIKTCKVASTKTKKKAKAKSSTKSKKTKVVYINPKTNKPWSDSYIRHHMHDEGEEFLTKFERREIAV